MRNTLRISILISAITLFCPRAINATPRNGPLTLSLNGKWYMGYSRNYDLTVGVPGIHNDPTRLADEVLWYKKVIELPEGNWKKVTLELKGARFRPRVFVNGELVGEKEGGMTRIFIPMDHHEVQPGHTVTLEIALSSLANVPPSDASYIPETDQWRSNVSSCLWDDVVMHFHGDVRIKRIIPEIDYGNQQVSVRFDLDAPDTFKGRAMMRILNDSGQALITGRHQVAGSRGVIEFDIDHRLESWSPEDPNLYTLELSIMDTKGAMTDRTHISFGVKSVGIEDKHFQLNGHPFFPRGVTVVWHRWMRTQEGRELGYDTAWFRQHIIQRTKDLGGNYLRFHLGVPPERFLDLCDRYGLAVQFEWSFFHGAPASKESLLVQYRDWLDVAMCHPSVSFLHPYNETEGEQLQTVWAALDSMLPDYPPLVMEDRDVIHVHKYWWSLFENLGLYYDDARVFPKAIMVDEFGGNYLDGEGNMGGYTTVRETFLRFLGRDHTAEDRLEFQSLSNGKVAEYWRRIEAAGISPFCALGSYQDGNNWFLGPLREGNPKPVWEALTAAFSPQSVSIELWDRNFAPGQSLRLPVYLFNDTDREDRFRVELTIRNAGGEIIFDREITSDMSAFTRKVEHVDLVMPESGGDYRIAAELVNRPSNVKHPVVSAWDFRVVRVTVPEPLRQIKVAVPENDAELKQFLSDLEIQRVDLEDNSADVLITSLDTWRDLAAGDTSLSERLHKAILSGKSIVMLDVGDRSLGQGYPKKAGDLGPLQGVVRLVEPSVNQYSLFAGISLKFTEAAEPESHLHPAMSNRELWNNLQEEYTRLWNGYRGGLMVPASDMEFSGLDQQAFISQWESRGADKDCIMNGPCYAYELQGYYAFSEYPDDRKVQKALKEKVSRLLQDAPALAVAINPNTPIIITDLHREYRDALDGSAARFTPLASCGRNLTRTPVAMIEFGKGRGSLMVSQLLTGGRLAAGFGEEGLYGVRYDPVAVQYVLNMLGHSVSPD